MLQGITCYVDTSTEPHNPAHNTKPAGLGILIVNMQAQPESKIHIKAILQDTSSAIMPEAAAVALAAKIFNIMQVTEAQILSDNITLLQFLNDQDRNHPPDWRMKPYIQDFDVCSQNSTITTYKISRENNEEVDLLARQALAFSLTRHLRIP
jgi:ribonuclease HI